MNTNLITCILTLVACCTWRVLGLNLEDMTDREPERSAGNLSPLERESNSELRKFLLKKLRFREVLRDTMLTPDELSRSAESAEESERKKLRKLLSHALRFREVTPDTMLTPEEILKSAESEEEEFGHKAVKRQQMDDILSRVKALISNIKERQIKETMSLPSLRFGRSGMNFKVYHK